MDATKVLRLLVEHVESAMSKAVGGFVAVNEDHLGPQNAALVCSQFDNLVRMFTFVRPDGLAARAMRSDDSSYTARYVSVTWGLATVDSVVRACLEAVESARRDGERSVHLPSLVFDTEMVSDVIDCLWRNHALDAKRACYARGVCILVAPLDPAPIVAELEKEGPCAYATTYHLFPSEKRALVRMLQERGHRVTEYRDHGIVMDSNEV